MDIELIELSYKKPEGFPSLHDYCKVYKVSSATYYRRKKAYEEKMKAAEWPKPLYNDAANDVRHGAVYTRSGPWPNPAYYMGDYRELMGEVLGVANDT